jgi:polyphosphate kinase 2 (PPK2 family)
MLPSEILKKYCVRKGNKFRLADVDPADTCDLDINKSEAKEMLAASIKRLSDLQERLHADRRWALLAILQGMDAAGKDGVIKHVLSGINPQGCDVHSFAKPSTLELSHDFMWRAVNVLPARGKIGIFNRSYYEEVLVVRVQPDLLKAQRLPEPAAGYRELRELSGAQRHPAHQVLPLCLEEGAASPPDRTHRRSG